MKSLFFSLTNLRLKRLAALAAFALVTAVSAPAGAMEMCPQKGSMRSPASDKATSITFEVDRAYRTPLSLYWIDYNGNWKRYATLRAGQPYTQLTFAGHIWIVTDGTQCDILTAQNFPSREPIVPDGP